MSKTNHNIGELDPDWIELILEAKRIGINKEEILFFLSKGKKTESDIGDR